MTGGLWVKSHVKKGEWMLAEAAALFPRSEQRGEEDWRGMETGAGKVLC